MDNYGVNGRQAPITAWAKFATLGVLSHNLHIERYHRTIKMVLKPNINLPCFCIGLIKINRFFKRKTILASEDIRGIGLSKSQKDYNGCHPNDSELYSVTKTSDGYLIAKAQPNGGISTYQLLKNEFRCNKAICKVYCNQCPSNETCVHDFSCNCRKYAYGNFCKHSHLLALLEIERDPGEIDRVEHLHENQNPAVDQDRETESFVQTSVDLNHGIEKELSKPNDEPHSQFARIVEAITIIKEKLDDIETVVSSVDLDSEFKTKLAESLESIIDSVPNVKNPSSFPHKTRKRTHSPPTRSFFPLKRNKHHSN